MEDWDQETLEKVVESKGTEYVHNKPTEIVNFSTHFGNLKELQCGAGICLMITLVSDLVLHKASEEIL